MRSEKDSLGEVQVPDHVLWGAQTERSLHHFKVGDALMPHEVIIQYAILKKACALANHKLGKLDEDKCKLITQAADEIIQGKHKDAFPLYIYQTGSGTQTNMNVNEVISNLICLKMHEPLGSKKPVHPNDHVNMSQSSNDSFPTVMHMSALDLIDAKLIPSISGLIESLKKKQHEFDPIIKIGRTHLMDAVPLSLGQEFSGYVAQLEDNLKRIQHAKQELYELPIGGSAVGTGLNTHKEFAHVVCDALSSFTHKPYKPAHNRYAEMASHDRLVHISSILSTLGGSLMKIAHDLAWMGSGPRSGLGELILPENEPGSSIMPGKVNPTQCEALCMVAVQLKGYHTAVSMAGALGNFELNVFKPLIIANILSGITIVSDAMTNFTQFFINSLKANQKVIKQHVDNSLMLVTALAPHIGYDKAAKIALYAFEHDLTLKESALKLGLINEHDFDKMITIEKMINP